MFDEVDAFSGLSSDKFLPDPTGDEKILPRGTPEPCKKTPINECDTCMGLCTCVCVRTCVYVWMCVYECMHVHVCVCVPVCMCGCVCMSVCMCMWNVQIPTCGSFNDGNL